MIIVNCPYCGEEINILFREEIGNLLKNNVTDCRCNYCRKVFEIYQGDEQYKTRRKDMLEP